MELEEENYMLEELLNLKQMHQLELEAASAAADAERAALQRQLVAVLNTEKKFESYKDTLRAMLEFDKMLQQESAANNKLLSIASQLLKQVQDEYNELFDALQSERQQRAIMVGFLQGLHDEALASNDNSETKIARGIEYSSGEEEWQEDYYYEEDDLPLYTPSSSSQTVMTPLVSAPIPRTPTVSLRRLDLSRINEFLEISQGT